MNKVVVGSVVAAAVVGVVLVLGLSLGLTLNKSFEEKFIARCKKFNRCDCPQILSVFQQAYMGKDPNSVPPEAYDPLLRLVPFQSACNRMLFWSRTNDVAHAFTKKNHCYDTIEDTLLGYVLNGLTWCGRQGCNKTFTTDCPAYTSPDNPVRSFWMRASAAFAEAACGQVPVMLNADIDTPFDSNSVFGSIEVKKFRYPKVQSLTAVLVRKKKKTAVSNCNTASLRNLQSVLKRASLHISYKCEEVTKADLMSCKSTPENPCTTPCW